MKVKIKDKKDLQNECGGWKAIKYGFNSTMDDTLPPDRIVELTLKDFDEYLPNDDWGYMWRVSNDMIDYIISFTDKELKDIDSMCFEYKSKLSKMYKPLDVLVDTSLNISVDDLVKSIVRNDIEEVVSKDDDNKYATEEWIQERVKNEVNYQMKYIRDAVNNIVNEVNHIDADVREVESLISTLINGENDDFNESIDERVDEKIEELFDGTDYRLDTKLDSLIYDLTNGNDTRLENMVYSSMETILSGDGSYASDVLLDRISETSSEVFSERSEELIERIRELSKEIAELKNKKTLPDKKVLIGGCTGLALTAGALIFKKVKG